MKTAREQQAMLEGRAAESLPVHFTVDAEEDTEGYPRARVTINVTVNNAAPFYTAHATGYQTGEGPTAIAAIRELLRTAQLSLRVAGKS